MNPDLQSLLDRRQHVVTAAEAAEVAVTSHQLSQEVAHGHLVRLARGAYADAEVFRSGNDRDRHCLRARSVVRTLPSGLALSHHSAAALWGLPWVGRFPDRVHVARETTGQHRHSATHTIHRDCGSARICHVGGLRVVEPAYALLGVAAHHGFKRTVVAMDAALHTKGLSVEHVEHVLHGQGRRSGHRALLAAYRAADPLSESPGESLTRLLLRDLGYAVRSQVEIRASSPSFFARVDFLLTSRPVVVEFDGLVKYANTDGVPDRQVLVREKAREDGLRALGFEVVRLVWSDLNHPERVRALLRAACERASRHAA